MKKTLVALMMSLALVGAGAAKCSGEGESPDPSKGGGILYLIARVTWTSDNRIQNKPIEICSTITGEKTSCVNIKTKRGRTDSYEFMRGLSKGDRWSVTADQDETGFLQAFIAHPGDSQPSHYLDYAHRNDQGSITVTYTRPRSDA